MKDIYIYIYIYKGIFLKTHFLFSFSFFDFKCNASYSSIHGKVNDDVIRELPMDIICFHSILYDSVANLYRKMNMSSFHCI